MMNKNFKQIIVTGALALASIAPTYGLNGSIEVAPATDGTTRTRALVSQTLGPLTYGGLHETQDFDTEKYWGNNIVSVGNKDLRVGARIKTNADGITAKRAVVRNSSLVEKIADYGFAEISANKDSANITGLIGYVLPSNAGIDVYHSRTMTEGAKPIDWTEVQVYKKLSDKLNANIRAEVPSFDLEKTTVTAGIIYKF